MTRLDGEAADSAGTCGLAPAAVCGELRGTQLLSRPYVPHALAFGGRLGSGGNDRRGGHISKAGRCGRYEFCKKQIISARQELHRSGSLRAAPGSSVVLRPPELIDHLRALMYERLVELNPDLGPWSPGDQSDRSHVLFGSTGGADYRCCFGPTELTAVQLDRTSPLFLCLARSSPKSHF